jgi:hypothetical protein
MIHVLVAVSCAGHLVVMIAVHNWFYGWNLKKGVGKFIHALFALLVLALPVLVLLAFGPKLTDLLYWDKGSAWHKVLQTYLALCLLVALVWVPFFTLVRLFRKEPVRESRSEVVDVARQLGRLPIERGQRSLLVRLPRNEIFQIEYSEKTLCPPRLPAAWDGLTILQVSDLHFHGIPDRDYFQVIMERCAAWHPDLVAITGDLSDTETHHRWIIPVLGRLRWRVAAFAILGNHDYWQDVTMIRRRLKRLRMQVPENTWHEIDLRGEKLVVIGHEGPWLLPEPDLSACPREAFRLCLSHTPDNLPWAQKHGIDLMLSGHVHGGQIRIPPFGAIVVPSRYGRRHDGGTYDESPTLLHVSRGISGEHPVRYNCRPEVTLLTLRRANS